MEHNICSVCDNKGHLTYNDGEIIDEYCNCEMARKLQHLDMINDKSLSDEEFAKLLKLKAFW